jgi:hypothetical protein
MVDAHYEARDGYPTVHPGEASVFIQWKGTDLCGDFRCSCGAHHHIDSDFVYGIKCTCGRMWQMPHTVAVIPIAAGQETCMYHCSEDEE